MTGSKKWHVDKTEKCTALKLKETPISTTYGEFGGILLIDPTLKETQLGRYKETFIVLKLKILLVHQLQSYVAQIIEK